MKTELWERIDGRERAATVGPRRVLVGDVVAKLEAGSAPIEACRGLDLEPIDIVAALGFVVLGPTRDGPALIQERPRRQKLRHALLVSGVPSLFTKMSKPEQLALAAGLLQIHDFWDDSHKAAQTADDTGETKVSTYWHAIAHRREPDPGNASYWYRRIGKHAVFSPLAEAASELLKEGDVDPSLVRKLIPSSGWDPYAFIDAVSRQQIPAIIAQKIQREEMRLLLAASIS